MPTNNTAPGNDYPVMDAQDITTESIWGYSATGGYEKPAPTVSTGYISFAFTPKEIMVPKGFAHHRIIISRDDHNNPTYTHWCKNLPVSNNLVYCIGDPNNFNLIPGPDDKEYVQCPIKGVGSYSTDPENTFLFQNMSGWYYYALYNLDENIEYTTLPVNHEWDENTENVTEKDSLVNCDYYNDDFAQNYQLCHITADTFKLDKAFIRKECLNT